MFDISTDWSENTKILYPLTLSAFRASVFVTLYSYTISVYKLPNNILLPRAHAQGVK